MKMDVGMNHPPEKVAQNVLKQEAQRGPSEDFNMAQIPQYSPRSVASRAVLRDLGLIEVRGWPLKCFLVFYQITVYKLCIYMHL